MNARAPIEWQRRAYAELMYAFMLRGTVDWYLWGRGWDVIECAPAEVVPPLPCEPNWATLPDWIRWWAIDGDGQMYGFHFKPMGSVERRTWFLGAHPPVSPGTPLEMRLGALETESGQQTVGDWYMTLRRRPAHIPGVEIPSKPARKSRRKAAKLD